ncbi:GtrA family protein [Methanospirillum stamsii]|uniref:GtrA/DPMS transmembrane domain-containing protein n=1 Tax=Methanospirillum stamsii TaxID=1277351 RepID=A0A2V2NBS1_9EURY|nr:hypothetical protein DLD82_01490 [Methanospirillum stamsii]
MFNNLILYKYFKYFVVGAIGAITDFSIYTVLIRTLFLNYIVANAISITVALIIVFYMQKNWTFQYVPINKSKTFFKYLLCVALTYLFNSGFLFLLVGILGFEEIISKIFQIIVSTIWGFIFSNFFVFTKKDNLSDLN